MKALPFIHVYIGDCRLRALVDTGCSRTVLAPWVSRPQRFGGSVVTVDDKELQCVGEVMVSMKVGDVTVAVDCLVLGKILKDTDVVLGMDMICRLGGVTISASGDVAFLYGKGVARPRPNPMGGVAAVTVPVDPVSVSDADFLAEFNGKYWTVRWKWKDGRRPELKNTIDCYKSAKHQEVKYEFDEELRKWIRLGWLVPCQGVNGKESAKGIIPLMAVVQPTKQKVRPVMDFRELNEFVESHPGADVAVCGETIRSWRQLPEPLKIVDLRSAYLQIHVEEDLWQYQRVSYEGQEYFLTRLGFGLNCAPKIMTKILKTVLAKDRRIEEGTDTYIDDIIVNENVVTAKEVIAHLRKYGLDAKPPEELDGGRVLGLSLNRNANGELVFRRGNEIPCVAEDEKLTRRRLFSICGQLIGHYPVCGWLRVACSFVKRQSMGDRWEDYVGEKSQRMIEEVLSRVCKEDPVRGYWKVAKLSGGRVWCDASSLALGVVLEIADVVVEDAAWLRKADDVGHINVAELEAVVKGVNLAVKWGLKSLQVMTDSSTVVGWLNSFLVNDCRVKVTGMSEMIVKRRLSVVRDLVIEYGVELSVTYVNSCRNKADPLTRVNKAWLQEKVKDVCAVNVADLHNQHHFGVDRTLHLARLVDPSVDRKAVERCVRRCIQCRSVDPAPVRHEPGRLEVRDNWWRLALDVTHYRGKSYLTIIDCGPSRFAIWREVNSENAREISSHLMEIFRERGPPAEILMDNSPAFRSASVADVCQEWNTQRRYRAAYRPAGNGIIERHHRTIKTLAERTQKGPLWSVFWYNLAAKNGVDGESSPCSMLHLYNWRHPAVCPQVGFEKQPRYRVGDEVLVKPPGGRCTSRWTVGQVTGVTSGNTVDVDGVPRHVLDLRRLFVDSSDEESEDSEDEAEIEESDKMVKGECDDGVDEEVDEFEANESRPARQLRAPAWLQEYEW